MAPLTPTLDDLRRRIDEIDDLLQDLLIQRAAVVEQVAGLKKADSVPPLRPGREAQILRRLIARHRGRFPRTRLARIWRELLSGTVALQCDFHVAVFAPSNAAGFWDLARDHYGSHTPMTMHRSASDVIAAVSDGRAMVGILPMPDRGDGDAWWRHLAARDASKPRIIARLPFAGRGNARADGGDALVIARSEPEPSGADRSLHVIETAEGFSRVSLVSTMAAAGLHAAFLAATEPEGGFIANLFEFDELIAPDDARLGRILTSLGDRVARFVAIGAYARPLSAAELDGATEG